MELSPAWFPRLFFQLPIALGFLWSGTPQGNPGFTMEPMSQEALNAVMRFYQYDTYTRLFPRVVQREDMELYRREKIVLTSADGQRLPAFLAIPAIRVPPYPAVLLAHDLGGSKDDWWPEENVTRDPLIARKLLASGYAVITMDARHHGERVANNDYTPPNIMVVKHGQYHRFRTMTVQTVIDYRRLLDYLEKRSDLADNRIGIIGYGYGGMIATLLSAVDSRIGATVVCVIPTIRDNQAVYAPQHYAGQLTNHPILFLMAEKDRLCTVAEAEALYKLVPGSKKEMLFFPGDHRLPSEYGDRAVRWQKIHLKP